MTKRYFAIPTVHITPECTFAHPPALPIVAHLDDPALSIMVDFKVSPAFTIPPGAALAEAAMEMKVCKTHLLLVIDKSQKIVGMITTEDLLGEKPLQTAMIRKIKRSEVTVRMVMTLTDRIAALNLNDLKLARIGDIVETLNELKQHYGLVIEFNEITNQQEIRGLFSLWDMSSRVGSNLADDVSEAHSLLELQRYIDKS